MKPQETATPASDKEIRQILGSKADDALVMAVRKTKASYQEVLQAFAWANNDEYMGKNRRKPAAGKAGDVFEILAEELDGEEDA